VVQTSRFGSALRQQRTDLGFSPEKLAVFADVPVERVAALELGAPATTREIAKLAAALAVDPAALWRGDVAPSRTTARFRAPLGISSLAETDARLLAMAAEACTSPAPHR
jgi:transcriptional regulator with XRE-family HTH domain